MKHTMLIEIPDPNMLGQLGKVSPCFINIIPESIIGLQIKVDIMSGIPMSSRQIHDVQGYLTKIEFKAKKDGLKVERIKDHMAQTYIYKISEGEHTLPGDGKPIDQVIPQ